MYCTASVCAGVCGTCAAEGATQIVDDVHKLANYIACDDETNSEIVLPLRDASGKLRGVLDIDSEELAAFDSNDAKWLEALLGEFVTPLL